MGQANKKVNQDTIVTFNRMIASVYRMTRKETELAHKQSIKESKDYCILLELSGLSEEELDKELSKVILSLNLTVKFYALVGRFPNEAECGLIIRIGFYGFSIIYNTN